MTINVTIETMMYATIAIYLFAGFATWCRFMNEMRLQSIKDQQLLENFYKTNVKIRTWDISAKHGFCILLLSLALWWVHPFIFIYQVTWGDR